MAEYAKQQISYLNAMYPSLDTQEDKQAKALREIYKLCKTDEGYGDDGPLDYLLFQDQDFSARKGGYESENSEKIKDAFNKMITKETDQYDIKIDDAEEMRVPIFIHNK